MDWMAIEGCLVPFDYGVMAIDSHGGMIVRDGKGEDLPVQLFLALHRPKKIDKSSYGDGHTVSVLSVRDVQRCRAAFDLAGEEGKVHPIGCNERGGLINAADERIELFELLVDKCGSPESNRVIRLRLGTLHWYAAHSAFVNTFN